MKEDCHQNSEEISSNLSRKDERYSGAQDSSKRISFKDGEGGIEKIGSAEHDKFERNLLNVTVDKLCQRPEYVISSSSSSSDDTKDRAKTQLTFVYQCQRKGRSYKVYNIERRKSSDDSSSNESYSQILDRDSIQKSKDGYPRPLKRKRSENAAQRPDGSQRAKSGQEIDIFEVERRMLNDRLFHRYFEHNKVKSTPIWMKFEPVAIDNEPDGPYSKPIVRTDSMKTLRGSINRPSSTTESDATDTQTPDKPTSAVQELRKRFEDFQSGKSNGDNKNEKEGLQELLNRAASEFTGNIGDLDPELIEQGKKYLKAKGVTFGDLMSVAGSSKYSLKTIVSVMKPVFFNKIFRKNNLIAAIGLSALIGVVAITISASHADQLWRNLILNNVI